MFVRPSKYRHVFAQPAKKELCYENLKPTLSAFDSNIVNANGKYIALNSNGIGAFCVIPVDEVGKSPDKVPMFRGHTGGSVLDTAFDPFNDKRVLSAGEDGKILIWEIPNDYTYTKADPENIVDVTPIGSLTGHSRKVGQLEFNPVASDIFASSSFDYSVKIWNLQSLECTVTLQHKDLVTSFAWNYNGTQIATVSKDKTVRVWDARTGELLSSGKGHLGAKASRIVWISSDRLATTGFDRFSERQLGLWKSVDLEAGPIGGFISIDSSSGTLMPFFDPSTNLLFLAGKGDGNVRFFEFADDDLHLLGEYPSTDAQRGFAVAPKRFVNVHENEIIKAYKLRNDNVIEPLSFIVPRRAEIFQDDIYPDAPADVPALTAEEWLSGKNVAGPVLCSMKDIYEGKTPQLIDSTEQKVATKVAPESSSPQVKKAEIKNEAVVENKEKSLPSAKTLSEDAKVSSLLEKVNALSDDDSQYIDNDDKNVNDEWDEIPKSDPKTEPKKVSTKEENTKHDDNKEVEKKVEKEAEKVVKNEDLNNVNKENQNEDEKKDEKKADSVASVISSKAAETPKTSTLKQSLERLHTLVNSLEASVELLTHQNNMKDEKLEALEKKIDMLLNR
ncbi:hypothetical protein CANINC_001060 [Pichia inconspicua]|uniref:Coronin n=1 Tax=Pichia inconspicua TaxID=52247 RepID=A0A4T0X4K0_9ASCO|nr:hypothetical protein CANINC_001060 [[Candida] inconspicua]